MAGMTDAIKNVEIQRFYEERELTRITASKAAPRKNLAVEVFAGNGGMSKVLLRRMKKTVTNDKDESVKTDYHLDAKEFIDNVIPTLGQIDLIDFDSYGCPNLLIAQAFEKMDKSSVPFAIAYTDGLGLGMKLNSHVDLKKFYLFDEKPLKNPYLYMKALSYHFIKTLAEKYGYTAKLVRLIRSKNKNFVFGSWIIQ